MFSQNKIIAQRSAAAWTIKGGVGKTTFLVLVAMFLEKLAHILITDLDPQQHIFHFFDIDLKAHTCALENMDFYKLNSGWGIFAPDELPKNIKRNEQLMDLLFEEVPGKGLRLKLPLREILALINALDKKNASESEKKALSAQLSNKLRTSQLFQGLIRASQIKIDRNDPQKKEAKNIDVLAGLDFFNDILSNAQATDFMKSLMEIPGYDLKLFDMKGDVNQGILDTISGMINNNIPIFIISQSPSTSMTSIVRSLAYVLLEVGLENFRKAKFNFIFNQYYPKRVASVLPKTEELAKHGKNRYKIERVRNDLLIIYKNDMNSPYFTLKLDKKINGADKFMEMLKDKKVLESKFTNNELPLIKKLIKDMYGTKYKIFKSDHATYEFYKDDMQQPLYILSGEDQLKALGLSANDRKYFDLLFKELLNVKHEDAKKMATLEVIKEKIPVMLKQFAKKEYYKMPAHQQENLRSLLKSPIAIDLSGSYLDYIEYDSAIAQDAEDNFIYSYFYTAEGPDAREAMKDIERIADKMLRG